MQQLQLKYKDEVKKNSSLLKMNESLMKQIETYNNFVGQISQIVTNRLVTEGHEFDHDELQDITQALTAKLKKQNSRCECQRWKDLYLKETEESYRLSNLNGELLQKIQNYEKQKTAYEESVNTLIQDYLRVFRALHVGQTNTKKDEEPQRGKSSKKRQSSAKKVKKETVGSKVMDQGLKNIQCLMQFRKASEQNLTEMQQEIERLTKMLRESEEVSMLSRRKMVDLALKV